MMAARTRAVPVGEHKILVLNRLYLIEWGCAKFRDLVHPLSLCLLLVRAQSDGSFGAAFGAEGGCYLSRWRAMREAPRRPLLILL